MLIGYMRGKTGDDDTLPAQRQALQNAGCERLVEDLASEGQGNQPELRRLLEELSPDDAVVVSQLAGLGRSLPDVVRVLLSVPAAFSSDRAVENSPVWRGGGPSVSAAPWGAARR